MHLAVAVLAAMLPQRLKRLVYRHLFGWSVDSSAVIGCSLFLVRRLVVEENVRVSHGNVFKGCELVHLGAGADIGAFNWISAPPLSSGAFPNSRRRHPAFIMGRESAVTMRHVIDCSDEVKLGAFSTLGGMRSQVVTHAIDLDHSAQITMPVAVGERSMIFTGCTLLAGSVVPERSVVAGGAVVAGPLHEECYLYGGVPARPIKPLDPASKYFTRTAGVVE